LDKTIQLWHEDSCLKFGQGADVITPLEPEAGAPGGGRITRQERAAAARGQPPGAAQTEDAPPPPRAPPASPHPPAPPPGRPPRRLARVLDARHALTPGQLHDLVHRHEAAVQVRDDDSTRRRPERGGQCFWSEVPIVRIDIDKDRPGTDGVYAKEIAAVVVCG